MTVVLHEVGHGLGFVGGFSSQSGIGRLTFSLPFVYDRFAVSGEGEALLNIAQPSVELHAQLTSDNTFVTVRTRIAGNGGHIESSRPTISPTSLASRAITAGVQVRVTRMWTI